MGDKKCPPCIQKVPEFMSTYGDMMTLLMCFFVLLFAFSTIDAQKFQTMMQAFKGSLGVLTGGKTVSPEKLLTDSRIQSKGQDMKFAILAKELQKMLQDAIKEQKRREGEEVDKDPKALEVKENEKDKKSKEGEEIKALEETATVKITMRGVEISLGDRTLFDLGKADIKPEAFNILDVVYEKIKGLDNEIIVEGHTDNLPINTEKFPSNWELSTTRATNVLRYLLKKNAKLSGKISAAGYADTKPLAVNDTPENRKKNRRVDIIILKSMDEILAEKITEKTLTGGN